MLVFILKCDKELHKNILRNTTFKLRQVFKLSNIFSMFFAHYNHAQTTTNKLQNLMNYKTRYSS